MFSVVIPLYNKEKYIRRAIDSVLAQTYKDFELLIIDDGSTDSSLSIAQSFIDSRIKIIRQPNQGVGSARNTGIDSSIGNWVALLDADDAWTEDHLNEVNIIVSTYPQSGLVATNILELNTGESVDAIEKRNIDKIRIIDYFNEASKKIGIINSSSVCINKNTFNRIGGFSDKKIGEDLEYWAKVALNYPIAVSEKVTSYYFKGTQGAMESQNFNKNSKDLLTLSDISPSINIIINQSKEKPSILRQKNIRNYINSRLYSGIRQSLYKGDIISAKTIAKLALPQVSHMYLFTLAVSISPEFTLNKATKIYKKL